MSNTDKTKPLWVRALQEHGVEPKWYKGRRLVGEGVPASWWITGTSKKEKYRCHSRCELAVKRRQRRIEKQLLQRGDYELLNPKVQVSRCFRHM